MEPLTHFSLRDQRRVVARLAASLGLRHLALAEDAVQTAVLRALQIWPAVGVPDRPVAWLYVVARRAALDALRADQPLQGWPEDEGDDGSGTLPDELRTQPSPARFTGELDDDELALLLAACHPQLPPGTQVALALRTMAGLTLEDVAAALLSTEAAIAQRLARARTLLAGQQLRVPAGEELPPRRDSALTVLSLMFLAGQRAGSPEAARQACWEAIRLTRAIAAHPAAAHPDADALAAMLLFHGARLTGRLDEHGEIVPLPGQPRDRWDAGMITLGLRHLQAARSAQRLSRWHLLAGIAAEHALAPSYAETDWSAIVRFYEALLRIDTSAAPRLGHAIALAEGGEAAEALDRLRTLWPGSPPALQAHALAAMSRALERLGRVAEAREYLEEAVSCAPRPADARLLTRRLRDLDGA